MIKMRCLEKKPWYQGFESMFKGLKCKKSEFLELAHLSYFSFLLLTVNTTVSLSHKSHIVAMQ